MKLFILSFFVAITLHAAPYTIDGQKFELEQIHKAKDVVWGFDFISNDEIIFTERTGELSILDLKTKKSKFLTGQPKTAVKGQGGLLDVFYHAKTGFIFLSFSEDTKDGATTSVYRAKLSQDKTKLVDGKIIFRAKATSSDDIHFGARILVDKQDNLFLSIGDRNERKKAQSLESHHGKILRLTLDGMPAKDNPFAKKAKALPEIWSYGHRNPQGMAFNGSGQLYNAEMGPRGGDEVNVVKAGLNYGWPEITYGREYWGPSIGQKEKAGMEQPLLKWVPSISPSGMTFYNGMKFKNFTGNLFLACLSDQHIHRIVFDGDKPTREENLFSDLNERFRQAKEGPDGALYFSTDSGKIFRLSN